MDVKEIKEIRRVVPSTQLNDASKAPGPWPDLDLPITSSGLPNSGEHSLFFIFSSVISKSRAIMVHQEPKLPLD